MSILTDGQIRHALAQGYLTHARHPWLAEAWPDADGEPDYAPHIDPASLGLHLGLSWVRQRARGPNDPIDTAGEDPSRTWHDPQEMAPGGSIVITPGELILATTGEVIGLDARLAAKVYARSTSGRYSLEVCACAGWVDPGFEGEITLELRVVGPAAIRLYAGQRIAQLVIHQLTQAAERPYQGQYSGQRGARIPGPIAAPKGVIR